MKLFYTRDLKRLYGELGNAFGLYHAARSCCNQGDVLHRIRFDLAASLQPGLLGRILGERLGHDEFDSKLLKEAGQFWLRLKARMSSIEELIRKTNKPPDRFNDQHAKLVQMYRLLKAITGFPEQLTPEAVLLCEEQRRLSTKSFEALLDELKIQMPP